MPLKIWISSLQVVTGAIDECLNEDRFIVPGLGDYGDRYYGTEGSRDWVKTNDTGPKIGY